MTTFITVCTRAGGRTCQRWRPLVASKRGSGRRCCVHYWDCYES